MRSSLVDRIAVTLLRKGYTLKNVTGSCFDLLARNEGRILLIKFLEDANSITENYARQMMLISSYINASPIIIAAHAGNPLVDNVVYKRFGVYTLNADTFENSIQNRFPFVVSDKAGLSAILIGECLKRTRESEGLSLASLASKIGVSRKMVQMYESDEAKITLQRAGRLYDLFGDRIFRKVDIFGNVTSLGCEKNSISLKFEGLGFDATKTNSVPFDVVAKRKKEIILTEIGDRINPQLQSMANLLEADNLVIYDKKKPKDLPGMTKSEFLDIEKADELIKFIKQF